MHNRWISWVDGGRSALQSKSNPSSISFLAACPRVLVFHLNYKISFKHLTSLFALKTIMLDCKLHVMYHRIPLNMHICWNFISEMVGFTFCTFLEKRKQRSSANMEKRRARVVKWWWHISCTMHKRCYNYKGKGEVHDDV